MIYLRVNGNYAGKLRPKEVILGTDATALLQDVEAAIRQERLILPSPPDHLLTIRRLLADPDAGVERIAAAIGQDPALAARILKVTNSAAMAGDRQIESLPQAVARLGNRLVGTLVTSHALLQAFGQPCPAYADLLGSIQTHSREVAAWSWALAKAIRTVSPEEAMLTGLVHRIGMLPILQCVVHDNSPPPRETLQPLLEAQHPRIGALLLEQWHFPPAIVTAMAKQATARQAPNALSAILNVAIAARTQDELPEDAPDRLGRTLTPETLADVSRAREDALGMLVAGGG